jgi:dTDP-4-dehydrorhamnose 3,5-epimerase
MAKVDALKGVVKFTNTSFKDKRGQLFTIWQENDFPIMRFNHDKVAISSKNVLRGLHSDKSWKLITCLYGQIQLVVVNFIKNSDEYLDHISVVLDSNFDDKISILVPPGFLNGHLVLSDEAVFYYKWFYEGEYPDVKDQTSVSWSDSKIGIKWSTDYPILSERDSNTPLL